MAYRLARSGYMKSFEGSWDIEPLHIPVSDAGGVPLVASNVTLQQTIQPAFRLPPPISSYVRGISATATQRMMADLLTEASRIREGRSAEEDGSGEHIPDHGLREMRGHHGHQHSHKGQNDSGQPSDACVPSGQQIHDTQGRQQIVRGRRRGPKRKKF